MDAVSLSSTRRVVVFVGLLAVSQLLAWGCTPEIVLYRPGSVDVEAASEGGPSDLSDAGPADLGDGPSPNAPSLDPGPCSSNGWCWVTPQLTGNSLEHLWGTSASNIWAVGEANTIVHYDGTGWQVVASGGPTTVGFPTIHRIWGHSPSSVYAVGTDPALNGKPLVLHFDGTTWRQPFVPGLGALYGLWGHGDSGLIAVGLDGLALHFDGYTWREESTNSARTLYDVWGSSASDVYAVGAGGTLRHFDGTAWSTTSSPTTQNLTSIWGISSSEIWATSITGELLRYDGTSWQLIHDEAASIYGLWGRSSTAIYLATSTGVTFYNGTSFSVRSDALAVSAIWGDAAGETFAVGAYGRILRESQALFERVEGWERGYRDVWARASTDAYFTSFDGLFHYDGSAINAVGGLSGRHPDLVCALPSGTLLLVVESGLRVLAGDGGGSWADISGTLNGGIVAIYCLPDSEHAFAAGWQGGLYHYDGTTWSSDKAADERFSGVWASSPTDAYAVDGGRLAHYDGTSWTVSDLPTFSAAGVWGRGPTELFLFSNGNSIASFDGVEPHAPFFQARNNVVTIRGDRDTTYAFDSRGGVYRFDGTSWQPEQHLGTMINPAAWVAPDGVFAADAAGVLLKR